MPILDMYPAKHHKFQLVRLLYPHENGTKLPIQFSPVFSHYQNQSCLLVVELASFIAEFSNL